MPCTTKKTGVPLHYTAAAGTLTLEIVSTKGAVTFDPDETDVTIEASGAAVATTCTPTQLSFNGVAGNSYNVDILFIFSDPFNGAGELREVCSGAANLFDVDPQFINPTLTIAVS
jgi:hypothetical protein